MQIGWSRKVTKEEVYITKSDGHTEWVDDVVAHRSWDTLHTTEPNGTRYSEKCQTPTGSESEVYDNDVDN